MKHPLERMSIRLYVAPLQKNVKAEHNFDY